MGVLPTTRSGQLEWFEARINGWILRAPEIGITTAQANSLKALVMAARTASTAADTARAAAKAATETFYNAVTAMRTPGRAYIATIKAFAEATENPNVYALAQIDPPAPPTPVPAPDMPTDFTGSVSPTGVVTLTWSATRSGVSSGVFFIVARQREGEPNFTVISGTPILTFIDPEPKVCDGTVMYQVRARRGDLFSAWTTPLSFSLNSGPMATQTIGDAVDAEGDAKEVA